MANDYVVGLYESLALSETIKAPRGSIQFTNTSGQLRLTAGPASATAFTFSTWVKITTDTNFYALWLSLQGSSTTYLETGFDITGTGVEVNDLTTERDLGINFTVGSWYFVSISMGASGAVTMFTGPEGGNLSKYTTTLSNLTFPLTDALLGGELSYEHLAGAMAQTRFWNAVLTDAETIAEFYSDVPVRTSNIGGHWKFENTTAKLTDSSGQSNTLSNPQGTGTWAYSAGPTIGPAPFGAVTENVALAETIDAVYTSSGGGSYTGSVSETVTLSEAIGSVRAAIAGISETNALSESLASLRAAIAAIAETVTNGESLGSVRAATVATSETVTVSESLGTQSNEASGLAETVTLSESVTNGSAYTAAPSETVALSESLASLSARVAALAETVTLAETLFGKKGNLEFVSEFWTNSEALTAGTSNAYTGAVSETVQLARALPEFAETDLHLVADDWSGGDWVSRVGGFTAVLNGSLTKGIAGDLERAEISGFGASDYFTLPANAAHETTLATQLTYEFVIRAHPSGGALMGRYGVPYSGSYDLATFSTAVGGVYNDAGTDYFGLAIGAHAIIARCYVVTFVLDSPNATWKVYVDGELDGVNTGGVGTLNNTTPADFFIGNSNGNPSPYAGAIVEIVRTRRVLTDPEINARRVHLLQVGTATTAAVSESVSVSDSVGAAYSAQPTPSETVTLTESAALAQVLAQGLTEGLGAVSESLAAQVAHTRAIAETVALSEALGATLGPLALAETVSLAELVGVGQSFSQTLTETVPFSEQMAGVIPRILLIELATPAPVLAVETPAPVAVLDVTLTMVGLL